MRHRKHTSKLNRTSEHRAALMRNLAIALINYERIRTTTVKAKQLRPFVEKLLTAAKENTLASKRLVVSKLGDKDSARKLWTELAERTAARNSGYLRIVKDGVRMGDGAPMAWIEFVDARPTPIEPEQRKKKGFRARLEERVKELEKQRKAGTSA